MSVSSGLAAESRITEILDAAGKHDNAKLERLLKQYKFKDIDAVDVQDTHGTSPLHAAIAASVQEANGRTGESTINESTGCATVRLLLENGAIWNQLNEHDETPGCIAHRLGLTDLYTLMVDAGVRAEVLLNRLEGYEQLNDDTPEDDLEESTSGHEDVNEDDAIAPKLIDTSVQPDSPSQSPPAQPDVNSADYLSSELSLTRDKLLDSDKNGVMMAWESDIMKQSVDRLLARPDMKILNIGAGMMIFDTFVQNHPNKPQSHHIVEAHPDILANIESGKWDQKPGVTIHAGRWQEILPDLVAQNITFDAIYYDTFAESYSDFKEFFTEYVLALLEHDGSWSFFNGMGADRQISYDVYQKVCEIDLFEAGFDIEWQEIDVPNLDAEFQGVRRKYWNIQRYRLPLCKFMD